jgi:hypothetical protein
VNQGFDRGDFVLPFRDQFQGSFIGGTKGDDTHYGFAIDPVRLPLDEDFRFETTRGLHEQGGRARMDTGSVLDFHHLFNHFASLNMI